jgi:Ca2+-binding EF-hand superfamily protein
MGCKHSIYERNASIACNRKTYEALGLNEKNINELYEIFKCVDVDDSGLIDILEMMARLQLETTPFSK